MSITSATARIAPSVVGPPPAAAVSGPPAAAAIERLKARLPDHARDLRVNLGVIGSTTALSPQQAWGAAVTAAVTARNLEVATAIEEAAALHLSPDALFAARGAASIMAMTNIYTRFVHTIGDGSDYADMPARLRTQLPAKHGVDALDFALWCLVASAITSCEACLREHEASVRDRRGTPEQVHEAVRIAAVVHAVARTLDSTAAGETIPQ